MRKTNISKILVVVLLKTIILNIIYNYLFKLIQKNIFIILRLIWLLKSSRIIELQIKKWKN